MIEVVVGESDRKSFFLHRGLLAYYSGYFRAALQGNFREGKSGVIRLPTEDVATFQQFVHWLYTGRLPAERVSGLPTRKEACELWLLADRRNVPLLGNLAVNAYRDLDASEWIIPVATSRLIYDNTSESSGLRRLDTYLFAATVGEISMIDNDLRESYPADAVWEFMCGLIAFRKEHGANMLKQEDVRKLDLCGYHEHPEGQTCQELE